MTAVLIVGAGPTGLTLACELARRNVAFRLIDSAPGPQPGSRGKGIQPRTLEVFDDLGIAERVIANGRMAMPMRTTMPDGRVTLTGTEAPPTSPDVPYTASLLTPQFRVEEALRLRLAEFGGAVEFGTTLASFEQSDHGVSAVLVSDGAQRTVTADWLVGCDGGRSVVRKQSGISFDGETSEDIRMVIADVQVDGLARDVWHMWQHEEGPVMLCPLPSTDVFQYQGMPGEESVLSLESMQAVLERHSGRTDIRLHQPQWASLWRANVRLASRYRDGRVFIAGDAAHVHSPAGGQGMNTGIQDAHNLGWKLAAVVHGAAPSLLDTYEAERRPVAAGVLQVSNELLRKTIEQKGLAVRRDATTTQLGLNYRGSTLARDDRHDTAVLRAGDRAPDATGLSTTGGERRLFDLTRGGRLTLLNFGAPAAFPVGVRTLQVVDQVTGPHDVVDAHGHLTAVYGATDSTLVLIRPDGYVGLISDAGDAAAVSDYLAVTSSV